MKQLLSLAVCLLITGNALDADNSYKVIYDGGSVNGAKTGSKGG